MRKIADLKRWEDDNTCKHPEHNPPQYIKLSAGVYEHICPSCGKRVEVMIPQRIGSITNRDIQNSIKRICDAGEDKSTPTEQGRHYD